jgi:hypothetical protein
MSNYDDLQPDLQPVIDQLRANRPEATALELDAIKQRVRARSSQPARRRTTRRAQLMKSRLVILSMLVFGMLLSTAGAGLAVTGLSSQNAGVHQYGPDTSPAPDSGGVLGDEDAGAGEQPAAAPAPGGDSDVQPSRQAEAGVGNSSGGELPFTGFAAIPILIGGVALLTTGLVLRRRSPEDEA